MVFKVTTAETDLDRLHAEQASAWIETLRNGQTADNAAFVGWLKESPRNVREILFMLTLDQALEDIDAERRHDTQALIAQIENTVVSFPERRPRKPAAQTRSRTLRRAAFAACVLAACAGLFWARQAVGWKEYQTATSEQRTFVLPDGSVIDLNTHSRVAVRLNATTREVRLIEGEALFRVHHDAARPFLVYAGNARIEDVGTQFNVRSRRDGTFIAVLEGQVTVTAGKPERTAAGTPRQQGVAPHPSRGDSGQPEVYALSANQEAEISPVGSVSIRSVADVSEAVAWRTRRLVFHQESLDRIVEEFNRYNTRKIRLDGLVASDRRYTGVFDADDTDSFVQVLEKDGTLTVIASSDGIVIRPR